MKINFTLLLLCSFFFSVKTYSQTGCGGQTFATAVLFDPAWQGGCANQTTCNGTPTIFNNKTNGGGPCEIGQAMDACAPVPSCGIPANNGYDTWFKFYATATTATIVNNPTVSYYPAIQAFLLSGGSGCANLVEIGCTTVAVINTTATLSLTGLVPGNLYYFRSYGNAAGASQQTGAWCFCGTIGLTNSPLPIKLKNFTAVGQNKNALIRWSVYDGSDAKTFEVERSIDGTNFTTASTINASGNDYTYTDQPQINKIILYRLKSTSINGHVEYSKIIPVNLSGRSSITVYPTLATGSVLDVESSDNVVVNIINATGAVVAKQTLAQGHNHVDISNYKNGMYYIKNVTSGDVTKFVVSK